MNVTRNITHRWFWFAMKGFSFLVRDTRKEQTCLPAGRENRRRSMPHSATDANTLGATVIGGILLELVLCMFAVLFYPCCNLVT